MFSPEDGGFTVCSKKNLAAVGPALRPDQIRQSQRASFQGGT